MNKGHSTSALHEALNELDAVRESARLKLHLLSMDARTAWDELESTYANLKTKVESDGENVVEASVAAVRELAQKVREIVKADA